jgi:hypothetical protein
MTMCQHRDTANSVQRKIAAGRVMPCYWDEMRVDEESAKGVINMFFDMAQGREKARLNSDSTLKAPAEWRTILVLAGNKTLMDFAVKFTAGTDAGAVRLFEFEIKRPANRPLDARAQEIIDSASAHCGNAGRVYAQWLATHAAQAQKLVSDIGEMVAKDLGAAQPERFYVAGIACALAGASIAKKLGLVDFDTKGIYGFFKKAFEQLRVGRHVDIGTTHGVPDIEAILGRFIAEKSPFRLITNNFKPPGRGTANPTPVVPYPQFAPIVIHVGQKEQQMRIDKGAWDEWCFKKGYTPAAERRRLEEKWGATLTRGVLGSGTHFETGKVQVIVIPLVTPDLDEYNYDNGSSTQPRSMNQKLNPGGIP